MKGRVIETKADLEEGAAWLARHHPAFARILASTGPLPLRRRPAGFSTLLNAIVAQQVSTASAAAIWLRMDRAGLTEAAPVLAAGTDALRAVGLSRQKVGYAVALAEAEIDFDALGQMEDEAVIAELTRVKGIGRWTAEIYAMFSLGRADIFAAGDLALQEAARGMLDLETRPTEKALARMAEDWSPWRAVAARALWSYYRVMTNREGIQ